MKFVGRDDRMLVAGLAVALFVLFARPIRYLLDLAREVEQSSGLALVPALVILMVLFVFHQQTKRREAKADVVAAEADAETAQTRAAEMERLVIFGQALGRSLDADAIRDVVLQNLPSLANSDDAWVMIRVDGHWQTLFGGQRGTGRDAERAREQAAENALEGAAGSKPGAAVSVGGHLCLPLAAGGQEVGVLGVPDDAGPFTEDRRRVLAAAAALLAISLRNAELFREVKAHSLRDGLTGCVNRTHAVEVIEIELRRARRSQMPGSLVMFDIDRFTDINDRHGHLCGDAVLVAVGAKMREVLRGSDLKCRYGGEEFLVLLPETPIEGAKRVADTLRRELADMTVKWQNTTLNVTASFGVTMALPGEIDSNSLIGRADQALYRAKEQGRNCVRLSMESAVA